MATVAPRAPSQKLPNTVRITVKAQGKSAPVDRDYLVKRVLFDCCGFIASDLLVVSDYNKHQGCLEVAFNSLTGCLTFLRMCKEKENEGLLSALNVEPMFTVPTQRNRVITFHMHSPYVPAADVLTFLSRSRARARK